MTMRTNYCAHSAGVHIGRGIVFVLPRTGEQFQTPVDKCDQRRRGLGAAELGRIGHELMVGWVPQFDKIQSNNANRTDIDSLSVR